MTYIHKDCYQDELSIKKARNDTGRAVVETSRGVGVFVSAEDAPKVAQALLDAAESDALVVELPKTDFDGKYVTCQGMVRDINNTAGIYSGEYERTALKMLAVARRLKAERYRLADEEQLDKRRNAVLKDLGSVCSYRELNPEGPLQKAVDRIIELQDKENSK